MQQHLLRPSSQVVTDSEHKGGTNLHPVQLLTRGFGRSLTTYLIQACFLNSVQTKMYTEVKGMNTEISWKQTIMVKNWSLSLLEQIKRGLSIVKEEMWSEKYSVW